MATAKPNMGVGSSSSEHHAGDSSLAAEAGESSVGDPTPLSPTGSTFGAPGCPTAGYPATPAGEGDALTPHTPDAGADGGGCGSGEPGSGSEGPAGSEYEMGHGHYFTKKTFHKPTYCHHCTDMLWGLIGQGYICEGTLTLLSTDGEAAMKGLRNDTRLLGSTSSQCHPVQQRGDYGGDKREQQWMCVGAVML